MSAHARQPFRPIAQPRAHEHVAEQVRRQIALRLVGPQGALPPERVLAGMFGVGRATVQRAIAILEAEGLVERRRGRAGGTFVVGPVGLEGSLEAVLDRLRRDRSRVEEALTFRAAVEPAAAAEAARVRTKTAFAAVEAEAQAAAAADDDDAFMEHDTRFHLSVARASGNRFYVDAVERMRLVLSDLFVALPDSAAWRTWSTHEHDVILVAVERRRIDDARRAMEAHVGHTEASARALLASL
jgi:GntR family transcriptional repressor for pyruvate dehydrogenase complex